MIRFFKILFPGAAASVLTYGLTAVCAITMLSSCNKETTEPGPKEKAYIEINVVVPSASETEHGTRHGVPAPSEGQEAWITNLAFFAFDDNNTFELYKAITIDPTTNTSTDAMWDPATSSLRLLLTVGQKTVYVIANWTASMPDISGLNQMTHLNNLTRTHTTTLSLQNPPVMTAKVTPNLTGGDQGVPVELTRQIARVTVYPMLSANANALGAQVTFEGIKFTNIAQESFVFPQSGSPLPASVWSQTDYAGTTSGVITATTQAAATRYGSPLYIPEFYGNTSTHTSMVIKAKYNGKDTYYTIPINGQPGAYPSTHVIERNHSYKYFVTVQGEGSSTANFHASPSLENEPGVANITYELEIE